MRVLWVYAHPDHHSLNAALRDEGLAALTEAGHEHRLSDLYAMKWKAVLDRDDFTGPPEPDATLSAASQHAYTGGTLSPDIRAELDKLAWADTLVLQFPLWWYAPPAILKGWIDRVFVKGFAYGVPGRRYGDGKLAGRRGLVVTSAGAREPGLGPRGIHGDPRHILYPLLHGTLWYTGIAALPPVVVPGADRVSAADFRAAAAGLRDRVLSIPDTEPIPYRHENGGDYGPGLVLRDDLAPGLTGPDIHLR
ncbi:NAD(P)H-dependent oxidoreductase [Amycolatopsis suaedae]|uniref:Flavodoxin family protein n=1 Tax=Amycolatopsis suaedae TaxID=2510978 RepID=A0A4Q7JC00_9PSEU|nr:NAD(P)H-dependent oxidoreductase [Amycolatopsis suaedae]RZQ63814.1 flavodoxin family protein [Amycolatopsis suaedae]